MIPDMMQLSYQERLEIIGLWSLEERKQSRSLGMFKMYKGWSTTKFDSLFSLMDNSQTRGCLLYTSDAADE